MTGEPFEMPTAYRTVPTIATNGTGALAPAVHDALGDLKELTRALQRRIGLLTAERDRAEATVRQQSRELAEARREVERLRDLVDRVPEYRPASNPRSPLTSGAR